MNSPHSHSPRPFQSPSPPTKLASLQAYQTILYRRALHPELFTLKGRKIVRYGAYELEVWLLRASHLLRFSHRQFSACELVTFQESGLPTEGTIATVPCAGEHEFEHRFDAEGVTFMTSVQTETLTESLYNSTYAEMEELAADGGADGSEGVLLHKYDDPEAGRCLSLVDVQRLSKEVHIQCYHLIAANGFVLRTQSIFEHK